MTQPTLEVWRKAVDDTLKASLAALPEGRLSEAMAYALTSGGKRLRPLMCIAACVDSGGAHQDALMPACAVEMIHCYSLAHDDLPCMDDDDERRGHPSLHKAFDESTALLAGDALQSLAFHLLSQGAGAGLRQRIHMISELSSASGAQGMAGGQMLDLESHLPAHRHIDYLKKTQAMKTGAMFRAAIRLGLLSASRPADLLDAYSEAFGLAFQAADDLRDCLGTPSRLGKPPGSDAESGTLTWPSLLGVDEAKSAFNEHRESCLEHLRQVAFDATELTTLTRLALNIEDLR